MLITKSINETWFQIIFTNSSYENDKTKKINT